MMAKFNNGTSESESMTTQCSALPVGGRRVFADSINKSMFHLEPTTMGVVDAVATLLGHTLSASCCASNVTFPWLVGDSFEVDHDGRGRRRRNAFGPHVWRQLLCVQCDLSLVSR